MSFRLGDIPPAPSASSALHTRLVLTDGALSLRWFHCGATAEFVGDFFAGLAGAAGFDARDARHSIGYLTNEILENAVKFRVPGAGPVTLASSLDGGVFQLRLASLVAEEAGTRFRQLLTELLSRDAGELLLERIEANAAGDAAGGSGLGLLTLINDYGARLGWSFDAAGAGLVRVETCAELSLA